MHTITIRGERKKRTPIEFLKDSFKNRLVIIALVIFIAGITLFAYSRSIEYTTYDHISVTQTGTVVPGQISNATGYSSIADYPTNISFSFSGSQELHYELYSISQYEVNSLQVTQISLVKSGNVSPGESVILPQKTSSQNYYIHLTTIGTNNTVSYSVTVDTVIPKLHYGNPNIGIPALFIITAGAVFLAFSMTYSLRKT